MDATELIRRIDEQRAVIGVVGLGYVGLPLVLTYGGKGFRVVGFDVDGRKVEQLAAGESYIRHIPAERIRALGEAGRFSPTTDFARVAECDALLLCVPTPLNKNREPDMQYVAGTGKAIAPHLRAGQLVVLESTTYPGTTDELLRDILEAHSGLHAGDDFWLAYSPEREDPGNPEFDTQRIPKVVGGLTPTCLEVAVAVYRAVLDRVVPVSSTRVAEMTKLLENIFRSVNIALVNEMKLVCQRMGVDIWEVIEASATKPFGFMPFYPGPGLGGHCIPIDPFYLTWKAREYELSTRFIELAGEVNTSMPRYVVDRTMKALNQQGKPIKESRVLVLGVAYKQDVDDIRESPALRIIDRLEALGARVSYHDPYISRVAPTRHHEIEMTSVSLDPVYLQQTDAVVIVTAHSAIDYQALVDHAPLVVDTRNATQNVSRHREKIVKA